MASGSGLLRSHRGILPPLTEAAWQAEFAKYRLTAEFRMESGRALPVMSRFEGPITVAMTGDVPKSAGAELARLMGLYGWPEAAEP